MVVIDGILTIPASGINDCMEVNFKAFLTSYTALKSGLPIPTFSAKFGSATFKSCTIRFAEIPIVANDVLVFSKNNRALRYITSKVMNDILNLHA